MRDVLLLQAFDNFDDDDAAGFVIAAQDGRAVGANDVAFNDWLDAFAGDHGVHVRAHYDRFSALDRARKAGNNVAGISADLLTRVVDFHQRAHFLAVLLDAFSDLALFARVAIDLHKLQQQVLDSFLVNHWPSEGISGCKCQIPKSETRSPRLESGQAILLHDLMMAKQPRA